jgi:hypothetical protein
MRTLVPEADTFGFGPGYPDRLVSRYVRDLGNAFATAPCRTRDENEPCDHEGTRT